MSKDLSRIPSDLPVPEDDGAADHLTGMRLPDLALPCTLGGAVVLRDVPGRVMVYLYPRTGVPDEPVFYQDWEKIPGARGCTPQSTSFRDAHDSFEALGIPVFGISTQDVAFQRQAVERLRLPFMLLSDADLRLTRALKLPTMTVRNVTLLKRMGLMLKDGIVEHVTYPVFPPNAHAERELERLATAA